MRCHRCIGGDDGGDDANAVVVDVDDTVATKDLFRRKTSFVVGDESVPRSESGQY